MVSAQRSVSRYPHISWAKTSPLGQKGNTKISQLNFMINIVGISISGGIARAREALGRMRDTGGGAEKEAMLLMMTLMTLMLSGYRAAAAAATVAAAASTTGPAASVATALLLRCAAGQLPLSVVR